MNPIVIDPPDFDQDAAWAECRQFVEQCGGLEYPDGEPNMRAASGADPGCCSCPMCDEMYWAWGRIQRCAKCNFEYPTDWLAMYSWGSQARTSERTPAYRFDERMKHPYYRYGFENPVRDPWSTKTTPEWKAAIREYMSKGGPMNYAAINALVAERVMGAPVCETAEDAERVKSGPFIVPWHVPTDGRKRVLIWEAPLGQALKCMRPFDPSRNIAHAMEMVESRKKYPARIMITNLEDDEEWEVSYTPNQHSGCVFMCVDRSLAFALCWVYLRAAGVPDKEIEEVANG